LYNGVHYQVGADGRIDMDGVRKQALAHKPKLIITGASAYPRLIDFEAFRSIADEVGAFLMADIAHIAGLVATGLHPSPFPHCDVVTTTTHKTLRGPRGGMILAKREHMKAMNSAVFPGTQGGPLMHCIAAKAVAFGEALKPEFKAYCQQVVDNAAAMAERLMSRGFALVSDGTDNHLMLLDLARSESAPDDLTGKQAELILGEAGITVNKNTVPGEQRSPMVTSGVRIGTPAMTTRQMGIPESVQVADWVADVLTQPEDAELRTRIKAEVQGMCRRFPMYPKLA
jgi:glycine hydroxymethyltransferase